jgi:predicted RND superfamily exporter protein
MRSERFAARLAAVVVRRPGRVLGAALALAAAGLALLATRLGIETSRTALLSRDAPHNRRFLAYRDAFARQDDLMVVVRAPTPRAAS